MSLTEEQRGTVGFDLEAARASISHYRIENTSNVDTESALKELVDQANLAEEYLAEIERLLAENEEAQESLTAAYMLGSHEKAHEQAARIKELEDALVEERAGAIRCESYDHCEGMYRIDLPDAMIQARQELRAEDKIGSSDHSSDATKKVWQITKEKKRALSIILEYISYDADDDIEICTHAAVLRAMLKEAE